MRKQSLIGMGAGFCAMAMPIVAAAQDVLVQNTESITHAAQNGGHGLGLAIGLGSIATSIAIAGAAYWIGAKEYAKTRVDNQSRLYLDYERRLYSSATKVQTMTEPALAAEKDKVGTFEYKKELYGACNEVEDLIAVNQGEKVTTMRQLIEVFLNDSGLVDLQGKPIINPKLVKLHDEFKAQMGALIHRWHSITQDTSLRYTKTENKIYDEAFTKIKARQEADSNTKTL